jgi:hypothetical protein
VESAVVVVASSTAACSAQQICFQTYIVYLLLDQGGLVMKGDAPRSAVSPQLGITTSEQEHLLQQGRGYVASRNEKLHLLARQKRQPIRASAGDAVVDKQSAAAGRNAVGRSLPSLASPKVVKLSAVLLQAPQHFDRVKVSAGHLKHGITRLVNTAQVVHTRSARLLSLCFPA